MEIQPALERGNEHSSSLKMNPEELKKRTKKFALRVLRFANSLPGGKMEVISTKQLAKAATSVGVNYRAACKARSKADFVSKVTIVEEEADETQYWRELLMEFDGENRAEACALLEEAKELTAIFTASGKTAKAARKTIIRNCQFAIRNQDEPRPF